MATVKKGTLTPAGEWWRHLRRTKRPFWKGERQAAKSFAKREANLADSVESTARSMDVDA